LLSLQQKSISLSSIAVVQRGENIGRWEGLQTDSGVSALQVVQDEGFEHLRNIRDDSESTGYDFPPFADCHQEIVLKTRNGAVKLMRTYI
jgi:hypothetical protein